MNHKENYLRAVRFEKPDYIPMAFYINSACWNNYDQEVLKDLMESHKFLFPDYERPSGKVLPEYLLNARAGQPYTDPWKCVWETPEDGITGSVHGHPLESWDDFENYKAPSVDDTDGTHIRSTGKRLRRMPVLPKEKDGSFHTGFRMDTPF